MMQKARRACPAPALDAEGGGRVSLLQDGHGVDDEEDGERAEPHVGGAGLDAPLGKGEELRQRFPLLVRLRTAREIISLDKIL